MQIGDYKCIFITTETQRLKLTRVFSCIDRGEDYVPGQRNRRTRDTDNEKKHYQIMGRYVWKCLKPDCKHTYTGEPCGGKKPLKHSIAKKNAEMHILEKHPEYDRYEIVRVV